MFIVEERKGSFFIDNKGGNKRFYFLFKICFEVDVYKRQLISCYPKGAEKLADSISVKSAEKIHNLLNTAAADVRANVNSILLMSALCGEIINS